MTKAVIFDWGGVIMRTHDRSGRIKWEDKLGLGRRGLGRVVFGSKEWNEVQIGERDIESYWQAVAQKLGFPEEEIAQFRADFYGGDRIDSDLIDFIRELKGEGVPVGLMSNNSLELHRHLETHGLTDVFDHTVISAEIGVMKPAPEAFYAILGKLNVGAEDSAFVDDYPDNIVGAQAIGMHGIHFYEGVDFRAAIRSFLDG